MPIAALGITYNEYVGRYLNKRGPDGMWWNTDTISEATGTDPAVLNRFRITVLDRAWKIYSETGVAATIEQLLDVDIQPSRAKGK